MEGIRGGRPFSMGTLLKDALVQSVSQAGFGVVVSGGVFGCMFLVMMAQLGLTTLAFQDTGRILQAGGLSSMMWLLFAAMIPIILLMFYVFVLAQALISAKVVFSLRGIEGWRHSFAQVFAQKLELFKLTGIVTFFMFMGMLILLLLGLLAKSIVLTVVLDLIFVAVASFFYVRYFMILPALGTARCDLFYATAYSARLSSGKEGSIFGALLISSVVVMALMFGSSAAHMFLKGGGPLTVVFTLLSLLLSCASFIFYSALMGVAYASCEVERRAPYGEAMGIDVEVFE